jgi:hypothetical protein
MDVEYIINKKVGYDIKVPDGATDEEIKRAIRDDISDDAYLPEGASLYIRWRSEDGRSGWFLDNVYPDVDAIMRNQGLDKCKESEDGSHKWTPKGRRNGLYRTSGTSFKVVYYCNRCDLIRTYRYSVGRPGSGKPEFTVRFEWA